MNFNSKAIRTIWPRTSQFLLVMKLTVVLFIAVLTNVSAKSYSQVVTLKAEKTSIEKILRIIEKQTGYHFFYDKQDLAKAGEITIDLEKIPLEKALEQSLKNQPLTYTIIQKTIVIKIKPQFEKEKILPDQRVEGKVTDEQGVPLPGVSIRVKGTDIGAVTDQNGLYTITIPDSNSTLLFTYIGFKQEEVPVNSKSVINVLLVVEDTRLNEVVVIGYGSVKRRDLTGSVSQVKADQINAYPASGVVQALSGRASGVHVLQNTGAPGAPVSVRIRGGNSIQGNNEPLYVIDGFPGVSPSLINNANIESIEVLKDASATAIYGSRGANGVILITTKHGKAGKPQVNFETSYSTQSVRKRLDLMNGKEYAMLYNEQAVNDNIPGGPYFTQAEIDAIGTGFDWQDLAFRNAPMQTLSLNVSGGTERTQYSATGSTFNQDGIVKGSNYKRYTLNFNLRHDISKKINFSLSSVLSRTLSNELNNGRGNRGGDLFSSVISAPPTLTPFNDDGSYRVLGTAYSFSSNNIISPLNYINEQTDLTKANRNLTNAAISYKPISELTIKVAGGIQNTDSRSDAYTTTKFINSIGSASVNSSQNTSYLSENTITYDKTFNRRHSLNIMGNFSYQTFLNTNLSGSGQGYISDVTESFDLNSAAIPGIPSSNYTKSALVSYLSRINYSYNDKYLATVSFRADGSSVFSEGDKWGYFPSAAIAWRVSNEDFFKTIPFISNLKLRAGWGNSGSQAIQPYTTLNQLNSGKTVFNGTLYNTYSPGTRQPWPLLWETTEQTDLGVDFGIANDRIQFAADYYIKNTRNLLNDVQLPLSFGYISTIQNIGQMQNKGFEFAVDGKPFTGNFQWDINMNISFNRNKVVKLAGGEPILGGRLSQAIIVDDTNILQEGQPVGRFYGYLENGYDNKGDILYQDIDNDGAITANDRTYLGDPNPDFIYGFNSNMSFKNFELSLFLQGSQGNDIFNVSAVNNTIDYGYGLNMPREVFTNHWTPTNTNAKYPAIRRSVTARVSDRFIEDGSYLRLKNIQLAYNIPGTKLKADWVRNIQLYASGQNLLTFTKYSWWDPEVNATGSGNSTSPGLDWYSYPTAKSITFGLRAGF